MTPYHPAHSTSVAGLVDIKGGDDRFYNNILIGKGDSAGGYGLCVFDPRSSHCRRVGTCTAMARAPTARKRKRHAAGVDPKVRREDEGQAVFVRLAWDPALRNPDTALVTTALLGPPGFPRSLMRTRTARPSRLTATTSPSAGMQRTRRPGHSRPRAKERSGLRCGRGRGYNVLLGHIETPVCHMAVVADPDGNAVNIHKPISRSKGTLRSADL